MFSDEKILDEVAKIQYLYGLKHEIRYAEQRTDETESVAEHIYGMHILAHYFLPLENKEGIWNKEKIYSMITWHDMDELETGDKIGYKKTEEDRKREKEATEVMLSKLPEVLQPQVTLIFEDYKEQSSEESRFVKALDKIEVLFQLFNERGKEIQLNNKATIEDHKSIKDVYVAEFPYMKRFNEVISTQMQKQGFFEHTP